MSIKKIGKFFYPKVNNKTWFCRNCCNIFYSEKKYNEHRLFCETSKTMIMMLSRNKYLEFKNLKNTIKHNFVCFGDIESQMIYNGICKKEYWKHEHLMSGYYLHCIDEKYSKPVQLFDSLEKFRDNLIDELDYIKNINENILQYPIDMKIFDKEEFDKVEKCKHCDYRFHENYNGRKISLVEKVDKIKLKK